MASGQQKARQNLNAFQAWAATQSDEDFKQIVYRGQLNRGEIAKAIGCGKSALNQNPLLREALKDVEDKLRGKGIIPKLTEAAKAKEGKPREYDSTASKKSIESKRLAIVEAENLELKAKVMELENHLKRFGELSETLVEMGFMPR